MIRIEDVSYRIDGAEILRDITLDIPKGGVTALIGPNGAGKSTLLSLIARILPLKQGRIAIDDLIVGKVADATMAQRLAILPQTSEIATRLTVEQLVQFGRYPHSKGRPTEACRAAIDKAIAQFDLDPFRNRMLDTLSGGQRQRALLAMACAQETDYLLLDEPLNNLDLAASRSLMRALRQMAEVDGKTIVIVLHDINYASAYADWIVILNQGRIAAVGKPEDVVTEDNLAKTFDTDAKIVRNGDLPIVLV